MVSTIFRCFGFFSGQNPKTQGPVGTAAQWTNTSSRKESADDLCNCIPLQLKNQGFSANVIETVFSSWRSGTRKQYSSAWFRWTRWCNFRKCSPICPSEADLVTFLQYFQNLNKSYRVIATHKAAILETLKSINQRFNIHFHVIARFMKGLYVSKPPIPRYQVTWDVS